MSRRYTDDEIALANGTDLPELLTHLGYQVRRIGSYYTTREMDSLRIRNRRTWYRYSEQLGGDAIGFLQHFHDMSFPEAVGYLLEFNGYTVDTSIPLPRPKTRPPPRRERPAFVLPPTNSDNERVCAYLLGRGIAPGIINGFIKAGLLYEDAQYHNCIFIGCDSTEKPVFAAKRGICGSFKGDVSGSDKRIAFRLPCAPAHDTVHVFEAPIDLMSWLTLYDQPTSNAVALCGLYDGPLETYLNENPHIQRVIFCLDADKWGREAVRRFSNKYQAIGYAAGARFPPSGKDWNDYLQAALWDRRVGS